MLDFKKLEEEVRNMEKRPFKKQIVSNKIRDTHAVVTIKGTEEDYEKAKEVIKKAVRIYNHFSDNKMSYEVRLIRKKNPQEKNRVY